MIFSGGPVEEGLKKNFGGLAGDREVSWPSSQILVPWSTGIALRVGFGVDLIEEVNNLAHGAQHFALHIRRYAVLSDVQTRLRSVPRQRVRRIRLERQTPPETPKLPVRLGRLLIVAECSIPPRLFRFFSLFNLATVTENVPPRLRESGCLPHPRLFEPPAVFF